MNRRILPNRIIELSDGLIIGGNVAKMRHVVRELCLEELFEIHKNSDNKEAMFQYRKEYLGKIIYISQYVYDKFMGSKDDMNVSNVPFEREVGEIFLYQGVALKVVEDPINDSCNNCFFNGKCPEEVNIGIVGECQSSMRRKGNSIKFIEEE